MPIGLGTAQFGLDYGVSNHSGVVSETEVRRILDFAKAAGVTYVDTATEYGSSEEVLGKAGVTDFEVVTKLSRLPEGIAFEGRVASWVRHQLKESLGRLNLEKISGLLVHHAYDLRGPSSREILDTLLQLKDEKLISKVGVSIYSKEDLPIDLLNEIDLIQAPINPLSSVLEDILTASPNFPTSVELHARSIFLQGLLLLGSSNLPQQFSRWKGTIEAFGDWCTSRGLTQKEAAIGFQKGLKSVTCSLVGVTSQSELQEIIEIERRVPALVIPNNLRSTDLDLIDPRTWAK